MEDVVTRTLRLQRPDFMVKTARHGVNDYRRDVHLKRALGLETTPRPKEALVRLMETEGLMNEHRLSELASYSFARHIEVLIAIICETATLRGMQRSRARATTC